MIRQIANWSRRRWYRSLVPLTLFGGAALPVCHLVLDGVVVSHSFPMAHLGGLLIGVLLALYASAVALISCTQMEANIRAALIMILVSVLTLVTGWENLSIFEVRPWRESEILRWNSQYYLAEATLVFVGAFLGRAITEGFHSEPTLAITCPVSRALGFPNLRNDLIIVTALAVLLPITMMIEQRIANLSLNASLRYAAASFSLGLSTTLLVSAVFRRTGLWQQLTAVALFTGGICYLGEVLLGARGVPRTAVGMTIVLGWWFGTRGLVTWLLASGWTLKRPRWRVTTFDDFRMNLTATDRAEQLIHRHGVTTFCGVIAIAMCLLIPFELLVAWARGFGRLTPSALFFLSSTSAEQLLESVAGMFSSGIVLATTSLLSLIVVHHVRTLLNQTMLLAAGYVSMATVLHWIIGTREGFWVAGFLFPASMALPMVVVGRAVARVGSGLGSRIGVVADRKGPIQIRSIMLLTLLVGVQLAMIRALLVEQTIERPPGEGLAMLIGCGLALIFAQVTAFIWLQRKVGRRSIFNLTALIIMVGTPIVLVVVLAAVYGGINLFMVLAGLMFLTPNFVATVHLSSSWLKLRGWKGWAT